MTTNELIFCEELRRIGLNFPQAVLEKLFQFLKFLIAANQRINLTAITDYDQALYKHLYDALTAATLPEFATATALLDIGSGAGIPVLPLAICFPEKKFVSVEATRKKAAFQEEACHNLGIINCLPIWARAEELAHQPRHRESYQMVLARAVAEAAVLAELTLPFAVAGGTVVFYKGKESATELRRAEPALEILGGMKINDLNLRLPLNLGERQLTIIKKIKPTPPQYPRKPGTPQKNPLF